MSNVVTFATIKSEYIFAQLKFPEIQEKKEDSRNENKKSFRQYRKKNNK